MRNNIVVIFVIVSCTIITSLPIKKDGEQAEGCPADYCSIFEGICQNGGTCISKGCKGECVCAKGYFGVNCDVTEPPITSTPAPTPKAETPKPEKKNNNKSRDFSLILSLFRMVSGPRPGDNNIDDHRESKKDNIPLSINKNDNHEIRRENVRKLKNNKSEKDTKSESRDSYPSRPDVPSIERNIKKSDSDTNKDSIGRKIERRLNSNMPMISSPDRIPVKISTKHLDSAMSRRRPKDEVSADLEATRSTIIKREQHIKPKGKSKELEKTPLNIPTIKPVQHEKKIPDSKNIVNPIVFSGKTKNIEHMFQASRSELQTITEKTTIKTNTKLKQLTTTTPPVDVSLHIGKAGHKVLSSTTLSNLYLTHTLLSKSRIFISNIKNRESHGNTASVLSSGRDIAKQPSQINGAKISIPDLTKGNKSVKIAKGEIEMAAKRLVRKGKVVVTSMSEKTTEANKSGLTFGPTVVTMTSKPSEYSRKTLSTKENLPQNGPTADSDKIDNSRLPLNNNEALYSSSLRNGNANSDSTDIQSQARTKMKVV